MASLNELEIVLPVRGMGGVKIDPDAIYDDVDVVQGLGLTGLDTKAARDSGELKHRCVGSQIFYFGSEVLAWIGDAECTASGLGCDTIEGCER